MSEPFSYRGLCQDCMGYRGDNLWVRGRNGTTLRLFSSLLGYDELCDELEKHAPKTTKP